MGSPESEYDFQRPDNPNRIYSVRKPVIDALASIVDNIGEKSFFRGISAVVVESSPSATTDKVYGLDIKLNNEGKERHKRFMERTLKRITPFIEKAYDISQRDKAQDFKKKVSDTTIRIRHWIEKYRNFREKRKK